MKIKEWEIWHTYSCHLGTSNVDLEDAGRLLVEKGIATAAVTRDGASTWRNEDGSVLTGTVEVGMAADGLSAAIELPLSPGGVGPDGFALEAIYQASHFRFNQLRVFAESSGLPPPYLRAYLGVCRLVQKAEDRQVTIFPVLLIYETGVVLVELRIICPDQSVDLKDFIDGGINLFQIVFDSVQVPPGLSKVATRSWYHTRRAWRVHRRAMMLLLERGHDSAIEARSVVDTKGDFNFQLAPTGNAEDPDSFESTSSLALMIMHAANFVISKPRSGLGFLLLGQRQIPEIGALWTGRPHTYLIDFSGRKDSAKENREKHGEVFAKILARHYSPPSEPCPFPLPPDLRPFDDFNSFVTPAASLWVWSSEGVKRQAPGADANRGHLIYEHQALVEMLEYGYMLHRAVFESTPNLKAKEHVINVQEDLIDLEERLERASGYGELREWLKQGWEAFGLGRLRSRLAQRLALRSERLALEEQRRTASLGIAFTLLFGLVAVPSLADRILRPLWELLDLWRPGTEAGFDLFLILAALAIVGGVISLIRRRFSILRQ